MTGQFKSAKLDQLKQFLRDLSGTYLPGMKLGEDAREKINWLDADDRPFMRITPSAQAFIQEKFLAYTGSVMSNGRIPTAQGSLNAAADAYKSLVLERFVMGGGYGVSLRPLTRGYSRWKAKQGLDHRVGIATKLLFSQLSKARWFLQKVGG